MIGCLLDLDGGQISFSLNGELLQDTLRTSGIAFEGVAGVSLVPAITLAAGQRAQLNFGRSEVRTTLWHGIACFYTDTLVHTCIIDSMFNLHRAK